MSKSISDFIYTHKFDSALQRLIMCRIWMSGSSDCMGCRYISVAAFAEFCCCSVGEFYEEIGLLVSAGHVAVVTPVAEDLRWLKNKDSLGFLLVPAMQGRGA
ncbi:TPA: hypothetical protein ACW7KA_004557 [Citrobacter freundii]|uniref:hypothetical protein n=1 Tax=Citrobacter freundii TaxID=546 RepID=UPI0014616D3B|nr:hypothetical protein [Citrobacter freundii]MBJ8719906.1 hypothetical protein [Citrobacter freundii]MBJ9566938.1 hypothetical protein [Citrobacter freundii]NMR04951.1 hypothetical protein [Citrobacter freundii]HAT3456175.1 hypothetical protein [Citrobacter freundii]